MITLDKWFPFVHPKQYDVTAMAFEKRVEKLDFEYQQQIKAQKIRDAVEVYDLELYNKRSRQNTIELQMFSNRKRFDEFV